MTCIINLYLIFVYTGVRSCVRPSVHPSVRAGGRTGGRARVRVRACLCVYVNFDSLLFDGIAISCNIIWNRKPISLVYSSATYLNWWINNVYPTVTSARSCNKVSHLFWFTILAQLETNDVILYIHSVHKHWENTFQRQNYKMRLKQRSLNWINSIQVKKIIFTNVFFSWSLCLLNMFPSMVFPKHLYFSGLLT